MRILHVNTINQVANLNAVGLAHLGHTSTIYQPSTVGGNAPLPIKLAAMPWRVAEMSRYVGQLSSRHFDIAHIHWASYGLLGLTSRVPFVLQCHGTDVRFRLQQPVLRHALTLILDRAAAVLCTTPDLLPVVRSVRSDAAYFPGPVNTDEFASASAMPPRRPWTIVLFSRHDPIKRTDIAIRGIERFVRSYPEAQVVLLKWGTLADDYQKRYGKRFQFISRVAPTEVPELLSRASVIVGQFGIGALTFSELHAMSCARPVITSFHYPEVYPVPPPVCHADTPEEVCAHLERLYQSPKEGHVIGEQAREWVARYHGYDTLAARLATLYQTLTGHEAAHAATS